MQGAMLNTVTASRPFIKICCIASLAEAQLAVAAGASALGLVSAMPSGPGVIADNLIAQIAAAVPKHIKSFLLTSRQTALTIAEHHRFCKSTTLQLVDEVSLVELRQLRQMLPDTELVQVIHVVNEDSVQQALGLAQAVANGAPLVDMLLLDSGNPALPVKELGGTGRTHNWALSRQIVEQSPIPVLLAGGLNTANAAKAIQTVRPHGLDICSGVRTGGDLDAGKLRDFLAVVAHAMKACL